MRTHIILLAVFTTIYTLSMADAQAKDEVYRWVDENGVVHFENQAPRQANAEKITIKSDRSTNRLPDPDAIDETTDESIETETTYAQKKREERAKKRQEAADKEKLIAANCEQARADVARLEPMTRVLVEQEDGTVVRMDDNDRLEKLGEAKAYIAKKCRK